jgi:hypothetical protein
MEFHTIQLLKSTGEENEKTDGSSVWVKLDRLVFSDRVELRK